jgi:hypothetical protein
MNKLLLIVKGLTKSPTPDEGQQHELQHSHIYHH